MFYPKQLLSCFSSNKRLIVAYSGGLDSHVLLHALASICSEQQRQQLCAIHINHNLQLQAAAWAQHCIHVCKKLNVPCEVLTINAQPVPGQSPEAAARAARYAAFTHVMQIDDILLTAHHQDDQAETLLLQLFRGAGVKGLAAMPELTPFALGYHLRPLLAFTRTELQLYAQQNNLQWIEDDSNQDTRFDRNYLRQTVMPLIKQRWPAITATLARTAQHCASADHLLGTFAEQDLEKAQGSQPRTLSLSYLRSISLARSGNVLRHWLQQLQLPLPSQAQLQRIQQDMLQSKKDSAAHVCWDHVVMRRYRNDLYAFPSFKQINVAHMQRSEIRAMKMVLKTSGNPCRNKETKIIWDLNQPLEIPGLGTLTSLLVQGQGIRREALTENKLTVRFRSTGERCHPAGRQGSHPLKKLFQEWAVPPWERDYIPLLYSREQLVAVVGYCICELFVANQGEWGWTIKVEPSLENQ